MRFRFQGTAVRTTDSTPMTTVAVFSSLRLARTHDAQHAQTAEVVWRITSNSMRPWNFNPGSVKSPSRPSLPILVHLSENGIACMITTPSTYIQQNFKSHCHFQEMSGRSSCLPQLLASWFARLRSGSTLWCKPVSIPQNRLKRRRN